MIPIRAGLLGLIFLSVVPVYSQTSAAGSGQATTVFRSDVRAVIVDVVVTNGKGEPIMGLPREDFQVFEDGQPQTLASFDEHSGLPDTPAMAIQARLPPNVFSNLPLVKSGDAANILLLDALNTQMQDQSYVHAQMIKYIKSVRPGTRLAIFTLGERLRFVQGFTGDPAVLMAAVNGKKSAGNPQLSPLIQTGAEADADQRIVGQMQEMQGSAGSAQMQASIAALQQFQAETLSFQTDVRVETTLEAMQQLALYLQAIPGRKNVIWFTGSFPLSILSGGSSGPSSTMPTALSDPDAVQRQYRDQVAHTANLLAAAQIAIYPIGAQGIDVDSHYDFSSAQSPKIASATVEQQMTQYQVRDLQNSSITRNGSHAAMDELARDTGGEAIYNTNGLNEALDRVLDDGTHYYTLTYSPANKTMDGNLRRIDVKLREGSYHLAYRRGYYATKALMKPVAQVRSPAADPLRPLMDHGTPDSTQILYTMHVAPSNPQPPVGAPRAGDNENLKGVFTRYTVNFTVSPEHLTLEPAADGVRHGNFEVTLLGYDRDGSPLNWMVRMIQVELQPDRYALVLTKGLSFKLEIDVPASDVYLRSGVYDQGSSKAGTMEIPLAAVVAQAVVPK